MPHQTSSMLDHHTGQGKGWWRTLLNRGVDVLRSLLCVGFTKASMSPLMDLVGLHSSEHASSPPFSIYEEPATFDNATQESVTCIDDWEEENITKKLAKGKYVVISDGSITDSSEDDCSTDDGDGDGDEELKQAMMESIWHDRELEDWIRFRTPGATFHKGETSGVSTNSSELSELQLIEMIHF